MIPVALPPTVEQPAVEAPADPQEADEPSDFNDGDWEVRVRLAFSGNGYGPQTLVTAFFNWFEIGLGAEHGVYEREYLSLGVGVEGWIGRPWLPEAASTLTSDAGADLDWRASSQGLAFRGTAHYTWLSSFDPYLVVLAGPSLDTVRAARIDREAVGRYTSGGLRLGAGGGISIVSSDRIMGGAELRYLIAPRFRSGQNVPLRDEADVTVDQVDIGRPQRPPRGLSWTFFVGMRF